MAAVTAAMVKELREMTGAGMMDCKKALAATEGDMDKAVEFLREKGLAGAAKKAGRIAAEGIVVTALTECGKKAVVVEVNAETDFVAKNEKFQTYAADVAAQALNTTATNMDEFMAETWAKDTTLTVKEALASQISIIGENMNIRRFIIIDGLTSTYIHGGGVTGVVISFEADDAAKNNPGFAAFAKNIALQVAAMPVLYLDKESVPASAIEEEKQILIAQIKNDPKNANKPDQILEKMVLGKIGKFYEKNCLTEQSYVKDDSMTVAQYVAATAKEFGGAIKLTAFNVYERGEGLQKKEENFGEEIAKMIK